MLVDYFWVHQDVVSPGLGFGQFSRTHFFLMLLSLFLIVLLAWKYKRLDRVSRVLLRKRIAVFLVLLEAAKIFVMGFTRAEISRNLPLEICSFGEYAIVLDAFLKKKTILPQMLLYVFTPAALMSIVFPTTSILPMFNFYTLHQFVFHALIIGYTGMRYGVGEIETDYVSVWKSIAGVSILALFVGVIDYTCDKNYMFLRDTYDNVMLNKIWAITGGGIRYDLGLVVFSVIVIHVFVGFFAAIRKAVQ